MLKIFLSTIMLFVGECINVKPSSNQAAITYFRLNNKKIGLNRLLNATSLTEIAANVQSEKLIILLTARCQKLLKYLS